MTQWLNINDAINKFHSRRISLQIEKESLTVYSLIVNCLTLIFLWKVEGKFYKKSPTPLPTRYWFSFNNSKTVKAVILEFYRVQYYSFTISAKFGIHNSPQSPDIGQSPNGGICNFRISGQSLIKKSCHNSRASDDIDMKLGPVTKLDKRNKATSKKIDDAFMSEN